MKRNPSRTLDDIVSTYELELDLLGIAARALNSGDAGLLARTRFVGRQVKDSESDIERLRSRLDEMTVVALWVAFERFVIEHIGSSVSISGGAPASFSDKLEAHVKRQLEYSRFGQILDLYKTWIDGGTIDRVKEIKQYRDWISHRNPKRPTPAEVLPGIVRRVLGDMMDALA